MNTQNLLLWKSLWQQQNLCNSGNNFYISEALGLQGPIYAVSKQVTTISALRDSVQSWSVTTGDCIVIAEISLVWSACYDCTQRIIWGRMQRNGEIMPNVGYWLILVYYGLSWLTLVYLGISWFILNDFGQSWWITTKRNSLLGQKKFRKKYAKDKKKMLSS